MSAWLANGCGVERLLRVCVDELAVAHIAAVDVELMMETIAGNWGIKNRDGEAADRSERAVSTKKSGKPVNTW